MSRDSYVLLVLALLLALCLSMTSFLLMRAQRVDEAPRQTVGDNPTIKSSVVAVEYGRFVLFSTGGETYAVHALADPVRGEDGITYTWYRLPMGGTDFQAAELEIGHGEAREEHGYSRIIAGSLKMEWSKGNIRQGWLYWQDAPADIAVYPYQFRRLEDAANIDAADWVARDNVRH